MGTPMDRKPPIEHKKLQRFLTEVHDAPPTGLEALAGGFWSSAYGYRVARRDYVIRLGYSDEGYHIDQAAARFAKPGLSIPTVFDIGQWDSWAYAISERLSGHFVETRPVSQADAVGAAMTDLLVSMRNVEADPSVDWYAPDTSVATWHEWLLRSIEGPGTTDWRAALARDERTQSVFEASLARIHDVLPQCPERRDWVHGDLLHQNVLVDDAGRHVTGVFSWKCSARGDFLYDVAWCTFWSAWHPVIAAADILARLTARTELDSEDWRDAAVRHHAYELQIATSHFGWYLKTDDQANLDKAVARAAAIIDRGPLTLTLPPGASDA